MYRFLTYSLFATSLYMASCNSTKHRLKVSPDLGNLIAKKLGENTEKEYSPDKSFAIYRQKPGSESHAKTRYSYIVVRYSDSTIVHEGTFQMGSVRWAGRDVIELVTFDDDKNETVMKFINLTITTN